MTLLESEPRRVMFAGDWHGNVYFAEMVVRAAAEQGADVVVQCGDYGHWEHIGSDFHDVVSDLAHSYGVPVVWIDGNHDQQIHLWSTYRETGPFGFVVIRPGVYYAPRAHRWTWNGVRFLALGGAYSIDKRSRLKKELRYGWPRNTQWWPTETITVEDVDAAVAGGETDVLVCHDSPAGVDASGSGHEDDFRWFPLAEQNRDRLRTVVDATQPRLVVHGHWHHRHTSYIDRPEQNSLGALVWRRTTVHGLGANVDELGDELDTVDLAVLVADLDELTERQAS